MRWTRSVDSVPDTDSKFFHLKVNGVCRIGRLIYNENGWYVPEDKMTYSKDVVEWLDESDSTHMPENPFRAEVAKSVLAALLSKEWSDMDLACEQSVKAADKLIKKLNQ